MPSKLLHSLGTLLAAVPLGLMTAGCDGGLAPPAEQAPGVIAGTVVYDPDSWPPRAEVLDLRFVALPFVPRDSADLFRDVSALVFSPSLRYGVAADTFVVSDVAPDLYIYSGVAQQYDASLLAWRPVGLVTDDGGLFRVRAGETTYVRVAVDFANRPPFPPPGP